MYRMTNMDFRIFLNLMLLKDCLNLLMYCSLQSVFPFLLRCQVFKNVNISCPALLDSILTAPVFLILLTFQFFGGLFMFGFLGFFECEVFPLLFICITHACFKLCVMINKGARSYLVSNEILGLFLGLRSTRGLEQQRSI